MNPLLCIFCPRYIPLTEEIFNNIKKYDKLWIKNYNNFDAHDKAKQFFIEHRDEYTHIARIPNDITMTEQHIDKLVSDIEENPWIECIGGVGPVDGTPIGQKSYGICVFERPAKSKAERKYKWLSRLDSPKRGICPVKFGGGYGPIFSKRLIVDRILSWQTDLVAESTKYHNVNLQLPHSKETSCCNDVVISHELAEAGVHELVDFEVIVDHLKRKPGTRNFLIGKKEPYIRLERKSV